tara:strand:+ start:86 stop:304 length:219 start_codon:yes stop_codon:yes gene_type:complete
MKTKKKLFAKFSKTELEILNGAVEGEVSLDEEYPVIYQKVYRMYADAGIQFLGDEDDSYGILIDNLYEDLID